MESNKFDLLQAANYNDNTEITVIRLNLLQTFFKMKIQKHGYYCDSFKLITDLI
jgi:hypothetical protein